MPELCPGFSTKCMAHYRTRWSCCDATDPCPNGVGGCARRWHVPVNRDLVFESMVDEVEAQEAEREKRSQAIDTEWKEWTAKARYSHKKVLHGIVRTNEAERAIVKRYELIKFK